MITITIIIEASTNSDVKVQTSAKGTEPTREEAGISRFLADEFEKSMAKLGTEIGASVVEFKGN